MKHRGAYPPTWRSTADTVKMASCGHCVNCGHQHDPDAGYTLTTAHLDNDGQLPLLDPPAWLHAFIYAPRPGRPQAHR